MGRNKSAERMKLEAILSESDRWWDRDELFNEWFPKISPSVAIRAAEKSYRANHSKDRENPVPNSQLQLYGARYIFNSLLGTMRSRNKIEERNVNGVTEIRAVPEDISAEFDRYTSVVVLRSDPEALSVYDPHNRCLVISEQECSNWSKDRLERLMRWATVQESEDITFTIAHAIAQKILNRRNVDATLIRAEPKEVN